MDFEIKQIKDKLNSLLKVLAIYRQNKEKIFNFFINVVKKIKQTQRSSIINLDFLYIKIYKIFLSIGCIYYIELYCIIVMSLYFTSNFN